MAQDQASQFLMQGINAAKAGQKDQARQLFQNALRLDSQNETAWLWMSSVAKDNRERVFCLQNLLQINPQNEMALKGLRALGVDPNTVLKQAAQPETSGAGQAAASSSRGAATSSRGMVGASSANVPAVDAGKINAIMPTIDEFLRTYKPLPVQDAALEPKKGRLYGEAAALRRKAMRTGLLAGAGILAFLIVAGVLLSLLSGGDQAGTTVADRATLTPSFTPTNTPTATPGATNTPSPEPDEPLVVAFVPPANLSRGSIYGGTATPIFPNVDPALGINFERGAVALYGAGQYAAAFGTLESERTRNTIQCFADTYYYQIVGLAEQGGRRNLDDAQALVDEAQTRTGCQDTALIFTAACFTEYMQGIETGDASHFDTALGWCSDAYDAFGTGRPIALAAWTISNLWMIQGEPDRARSALDQALSYNPSDIYLLLQRAQVEIRANNDLQTALEYINQALYVDPASEPALRARVNAYLQIAAEETDEQRQKLLYGTAVLYTQEYQLFYAGDPDGFLLLAKARYGEGNFDLAEEALTRIINNVTTLPENERQTIDQAYILRAQIYEQTARYTQAFDDVQVLLRDNPDNSTLIEQRTRMAYRLGRYPLALEGLNQLLGADSNRADLRLLRYRITTELCTFEDALQCDYETAFSEITDEFIETLPTPEAQSEARAYRGIALYHLTQDTPESALSASQRNNQYEAALADLTTAAATSQTPVNVYYQGLIQEALENVGAAFGAYNYIAYWSQFYEYPFIEDVQERIEALADEIESNAS